MNGLVHIYGRGIAVNIRSLATLHDLRGSVAKAHGVLVSQHRLLAFRLLGPRQS